MENTFSVSEELFSKMLEVISEIPTDDNILKELFERMDSELELHSVNEMVLATILVNERANIHKKALDSILEEHGHSAFLDVITAVYKKLD
jgi:hypothetical protein